MPEQTYILDLALLEGAIVQRPEVAVRFGDVHPVNVDTLEASLGEPGIRTSGV